MLLSGSHQLINGHQRRSLSPLGPKADREAGRRNMRAQSQDRILGSSRRSKNREDLGLSTRSALNDRYFDDGRSGTRSKSLDNLMDGGAPATTAAANFFGLSESKLNKR